MCKIVVIGGTNTDMTIHSDNLPSVGEIVAGGKFRVALGGKGANEAIAASRLGGSVSLITKTGNDLFGRQAKQMFADEGIRTDYIFADPKNPSGVALIMVNKQGEKYVSLAQGGITTLSHHDIDKARSEVTHASVLLIELETPIDVAIYAARIAKENGVTVVVNPSPRQELPDELFHSVDIMIPNRQEASKLSGITVTDFETAAEAARIIAQKGVRTVIVTMGNKGALLLDRGEVSIHPPVEVETVDPSGAGDVFCSALCVALTEKTPIDTAIRMAVAAAAIQVSRFGLQDALPYRHEVERLLRNSNNNNTKI